MMALPYIWFYMQEEKSIVDVIDVFLASFLIHILKEAKLWISNIFCLFFFLLLGKHKMRYMVW
jgi:hypothetical protein